ncbi:hypothetical protein DFH08DRAFT_827401 [Mycena albidolilacea]|uniref:Uncharacterized protein n=1 Tax=Mycena albidolilacea TaxID=1033008 RepID=A0AAD7E7Y1_9AGAR|nr:hypothetical protein DFH08DRAFT_827401 [Mycena albidolilacea]
MGGRGGEDAGCGRENTSGVDPIDQGSAVVDLRARDSNYSAAWRENRRSGVGFNSEARLQGEGVEGTWHVRGWDRGEARRRRSGAGAEAGGGTTGEGSGHGVVLVDAAAGAGRRLDN